MLINNPVTAFISTILIIIFLLLLSSIIKIYPCQKDFISNMISNFLHEDFLHLLSNLYGMYVLSSVERKIGQHNFIILISLIIIINTVIETVAHKLTNLSCSIGFSAILYGLLSWEIITSKENFDYQLLTSVGIDIFINSFSKTRKIAIINHFFGIISGLIVGLFLKFKK